MSVTKVGVWLSCEMLWEMPPKMFIFMFVGEQKKCHQKWQECLCDVHSCSIGVDTVDLCGTSIIKCYVTEVSLDLTFCVNLVDKYKFLF